MLDEGPIDLTVVRREFRPWSAEWPAMSSKGKGYWIDFGGNPVFAEIAIVRLLAAAGWTAAWIDSYPHRRSFVAIGRRGILSSPLSCALS